MPTYEYRCGNCGHRFEKFSPRITDATAIACPRCDGVAERLISGGAGLLFRGSGFYITDYRSDSYKQAEKKETGETGGKPSGSSESQPSSSAGGEKKEQPQKKKPEEPKKGT